MNCIICTPVSNTSVICTPVSNTSVICTPFSDTSVICTPVSNTIVICFSPGQVQLALPWGPPLVEWVHLIGDMINHLNLVCVASVTLATPALWTLLSRCVCVCVCAGECTRVCAVCMCVWCTVMYACNVCAYDVRGSVYQSPRWAVIMLLHLFQCLSNTYTLTDYFLSKSLLHHAHCTLYNCIPFILCCSPYHSFP